MHVLQSFELSSQLTQFLEYFTQDIFSNYHIPTFLFFFLKVGKKEIFTKSESLNSEFGFKILLFFSCQGSIF